MAFLVGHSEFVAGYAVVFDDEAVAEDRRPVELADERLGELLEGVGEDDDLDSEFFAEVVDEFFCAFEGRQGADDGLDFAEGDVVPVEDFEAVMHEFVVVGFVAGGAAEFGDARALGDCDPDFRREDAFHVEGDDCLVHVGFLTANFFRNLIFEQKETKRTKKNFFGIF